MEVTIKVLDLLDRRIGARGDTNKSHLRFGDVTPAYDIFPEKLLPAAPIGPPGNIHQNDRYEVGFAGLRQGDGFQKLVVSAEAAGKNRDRVGFFDKHELSGK